MCVCAHVHVCRSTHATSHIWKSETSISRVCSLLPPCFEAKSPLFLPLNCIFTFIQFSCLPASSLLPASVLVMQMHTAASILLCEFQRCDGKRIELVATKKCSMASSMMLRRLAYCIQPLLGTWALVSGFQWAQLGEHSYWFNLAMVGVDLDWLWLALWITCLCSLLLTAAQPGHVLTTRGKNASIFRHLLVSQT